MEKSEVEALISLIDDSDEGISTHVVQKLTLLAEEGKFVDLIREHYLRSESEIQHIRLKQVLDTVHLSTIKTALSEWQKNGAHDLLEGYFIVSQYRYPDLDKQQIVNYLDKIKLDIWLRLNHKFSQLDNIRVINDVFFGKYRFHGDQENYFAPENSYINQVIENRKGNPISLSILYSVIAQKLYLPILGVNLPKHFVLAYKDDQELENDERFNNLGIIPWNIKGETRFYINAFNNGVVFSKYNIDRFLGDSKLPTEEHFYEPCSNITIILRVLRNLTHSYSKLNDEVRESQVKELHDFLANLQA